MAQSPETLGGIPDAAVRSRGNVMGVGAGRHYIFLENGFGPGNRGKGQKRNQGAEKRVFPVRHGRPPLISYITYQRPYWFLLVSAQFFLVMKSLRCRKVPGAFLFTGEVSLKRGKLTPSL
jgi:hypothetical protein